MLHFLVMFCLIGAALMVAPLVFRVGFALLRLLLPFLMILAICALFPVVMLTLRAVIPPIDLSWLAMPAAIVGLSAAFGFGLFGTCVLVKDVWQHKVGRRHHRITRRIEPRLYDAG